MFGKEVFPARAFASGVSGESEDIGLWTLDFGLWTLAFGRWPLDVGQVFLANCLDREKAVFATIDR